MWVECNVGVDRDGKEGVKVNVEGLVAVGNGGIYVEVFELKVREHRVARQLRLVHPQPVPRRVRPAPH